MSARPVAKAAKAAKEETRARIVAAALATLREVGIAGASARAIARRGGFNQALIFYYFGSINDLYMAAVDEVSSARAERYRERIEGVDTLAELIRVAAELHREDVEQGHIAVLAQMLAGATTAPDLKEPLYQRFLPWTTMVESAIERVIAGSPYAGIVPVADLAFVVTALFMGIELTMSLEQDPEREERLFQSTAVLAQLIDGIVRPRPTSASDTRNGAETAPVRVPETEG